MMDMVPGLLIEKHFLSAYDLRTHASPMHCYPPDTVMLAAISDAGMDTKLSNPLANVSESVLQLISFGAEEVWTFKKYIYY